MRNHRDDVTCSRSEKTRTSVTLHIWMGKSGLGCHRIPQWSVLYPWPALASLVVRWCASAGRCLEHDYAASNRIIPWEMYKATTRQRTAVLPLRAGVDFMLP